VALRIRIPLILLGLLAAVQPAPIIAQERQPPALPPAVVPAPPPPFHLRDADLDLQLHDRRDRFSHALRDEFNSYVAALGAVNRARAAGGGAQAWAAARQAVATELRQTRAVAAAEFEFRGFLAQVGGSLSAREVLHDADCLMKDNVIVGQTRGAELAQALLQEEQR
jgi:hypothetical protein